MNLSTSQWLVSSKILVRLKGGTFLGLIFIHGNFAKLKSVVDRLAMKAFIFIDVFDATTPCPPNPPP